MAMEARTPKRLIICIDGTYCNPDGTHGRRFHNITNIYRFCASVRTGECIDRFGNSYIQEKRYFPGIASENDIALGRRVVAGILGSKCLDQIRDAYRECCRLDGPEDEVWLYGFSRGAYVARAVAGLLHYLRALVSADDQDKFQHDYREALKMYKKMHKDRKLGDGQIHQLLSSTTKPAPTIKFVGAFDTVKAVDDEFLHDLSFNGSIQHLRHALALNENRRAFGAEYIYPNFNHPTTSLIVRTCLQAWFIGAHIDIGGSAAQDGLSLYPLQWMMIESRDIGLCLQFDGSFGGRAPLANPLQLVGLLDADQEPNIFTTENKVVIKMQDIRQLHSPGGQHGSRYQVRINQNKDAFWIRKNRQPFDSDDELTGYCLFAPQGTIVHPSAYLIMDEYHLFKLDESSATIQSCLAKWRYRMMGDLDGLPNRGFWNLNQPENPNLKPGAIRILVCGNTGVGKSTLINTVFGVSGDEEVTQTSHRDRGTHNVDVAITWPNRPDLIIHDSGGFEAGGDAELQAIEEFLKQKSNVLDIDERLHMIWFCVEINSARAKQTAAEKLFKVVSQHAKDVPLLIIATKKDEFEDMKAGERRRQAKKEGITISEEDIDSYAEHQLQERLCKITEEMHEIAGGRIDECVAVSQEDKESISELTQKTADCFGTERVRLLYIRAQVTRVDLKIDLALAETMRVYRHILASSTTLAGVPIGSSTNKFSAAIHILRAILTCFGLPSVAPETVFAICKANLWDDLGNNMLVAIAEGLSIVSVLATVASLGTMPMIVIPMVVNIPVVVPATARMFLMLACDMIFVLTRAFTEASAKCIGQPLKQDVEKAVLDYRRWCRGVHGQVKDLIPNVNVIKAFRVGEVEVGVKKIIEEYKSKVVDGVGAPVAVFRNNTSASRNSYVRTSTPGPSSASTILVSEKGDDYGKASSFEQYTKPAKEIDVTDNDAVAELLKEKLDIVALADS